MNRVILVITLVCLAIGLKAQKDESFYQTDTLKVKKIQLVGLPVVFYTPETSFGFGGGLQTFFHQKQNLKNPRNTKINVTAKYTAKKQFLLDIQPQIFFRDGNMFLDGAFKYKIFPNSFWGIGNDLPEEAEEAYNMETIAFRIAWLERIPPSMNFGLEYFFEKHIMLERAEGGLLAADSIPGSTGAQVSGMGAVFNLDDRTDVFSPRGGNYMQIKVNFSGKVFGANYSYNKFIIDLRKYFPLAPKHILAVQIYNENNFGDVPFQVKAHLGGPDRTRGYFRGRYIDDHMYAIQAEYRLRFKPRWVAAAFGSVGDVASLPSEFSSDPKFSFGGGIRFQLLKTNQTLLRLDIGIGENGSSGIYFGVNEAF